jgi:hypothetical protein
VVWKRLLTLTPQAFSRDQQDLGTDHFYTLAVMGNTVRVYRHQACKGNTLTRNIYPSALWLERRRIWVHPSILIVHHDNLASVYELQNRYAEAEELYTRALRTRYHTTIARLLYDYCTTIAQLLPDYWMTTARLLNDYWMTTARRLHDYCTTIT